MNERNTSLATLQNTRAALRYVRGVEPGDADVAVSAAQAGASVVARAYGGEQSRVMKSDTDFATQVDIDAEAAIMAVLERHRPGDARTGEELGSFGPENAPRRWLVDPLCGTLNFAAGTPLVAVNVALIAGPDAAAAATADPIAGEVFWTDGVRAQLRRDGRDEVLQPTARSGLVDVNCDGPLDRPFVGGQLVHDPRLRAAFGPRVVSSTLAVAWVAAGRRAAYVSDGHFRGSVHFAAGLALAQAAGCVISDLDGRPLHTGRGLIVAADSGTHEQLLALVEPHVQSVRHGSG